jgi:hypothetical protein
MRVRYNKLRDTMGYAGYLSRLEDAYLGLWKVFRKTEHMPEPPRTKAQAHASFDIVQHLKFFRKNVQKDLLCVLILATVDSRLLRCRR